VCCWQYYIISTRMQTKPREFDFPQELMG
jgi:hypothetical protein